MFENQSSAPLKVVIIGPESTGKSTLCRDLAHHYNSLWCPEYAREYLSRNEKKYAYNDLLSIARGQIGLENEYIQRWIKEVGGTDQKEAVRPLFIDTNMYVMKVWCEYVFGDCHQWIIDQIVDRHYDLYLLCNLDLPWERDELREYPDIKSRKELFEIYKDIMVNQSVPWKIISGNDRERVDAAIRFVDAFIKERNSITSL